MNAPVVQEEGSCHQVEGIQDKTYLDRS